MQNTKPSLNLRLGELFCGAGGMGYGLHQRGFIPTWGIEADSDACETYQNNVGPVINSRVETINFANLPKIDGLAFGFPCNDFSLVGERKGTDGYFGGLYVHAARAIDEQRPDWFIAENVPGIMSAGGATIMQHFANSGRGYTVTIHLYKFEQYGVPQKRSRIVAVGIANNLGKTFLPPGITTTNPISSAVAIANIPVDVPNNERTNHPKRTIELLEHIPEGANAWHPNVPEHLRIKTSVQMSLIYRRLHRDEPSYTVVASGGGGTHMYHYSEPRALTNRERARLQTFDDTFTFSGRGGSVRKQIGMAVPPRAARIIGAALKKTLLGESYLHAKPSHGIIRGTPTR